MKILYLYFSTFLKASETIPPLPPIDPNQLVIRKLIDENISLNAKYTACRHDLGYQYGQLDVYKSSLEEVSIEKNEIQNLKSQLKDLESKFVELSESKIDSKRYSFNLGLTKDF